MHAEQIYRGFMSRRNIINEPIHSDELLQLMQHVEKTTGKLELHPVTPETEVAYTVGRALGVTEKVESIILNQLTQILEAGATMYQVLEYFQETITLSPPQQAMLVFNLGVLYGTAAKEKAEFVQL